MHEIIFFAAGASIAGTIFLVSAVELIFTIRRRKIREEIENKVRELKTNYNQSVNQLVLEDEAKIQDAEKQVQQNSEKAAQEKVKIEKEFQDELKKMKSKAEREVETAHAHAKAMEEEAKLKAEEYLVKRKTEVEKELMNLVMSVTKKVLPESLDYNLQKELVLQALEAAKTDHDHSNA